MIDNVYQHYIFVYLYLVSVNVTLQGAITEEQVSK